MVDVVIKNFSGDETEIFYRTIETLWVKKVKIGMPVIIGVVGKSGSGKSSFVLSTQEAMYKKIGIAFENYVQACTLIKPTDYAPKVEALLYDKQFKDIFTVQMDEAKFLVAADEWQQFKNKATRTITATCRAIKPMIFFIIAQKRSDIEARTRQTLDYYVEIIRTPGQKPAAKIYEVYEDKRKFNAPEFRTRGIIVSVQNTVSETTSFFPTFRFSMPSDEVWKKYKEYEMPSKDFELHDLLEKMQIDLNKLTGETDKKAKNFVEFLLKNKGELEKFGKFKNKLWSMDKKTFSSLGYSKKEISQIELLFNESYKNFEKNKETEHGRILSEPEKLE